MDWSGEPYLHLLSPSGEHLLSWGKRGEGPGDFIYLFGIFPDPAQPGSIWAYDRGLRLTRISYTADGKVSVDSILRLPSSPAISQLASYGDGRFLGWTADTLPAFLRIERGGQVTKLNVGDLIGSDSIPVLERLKASVNLNLCIRPDGQRFAVSFAGAGRVEIRDSAAALVGMAQVPFPSNGHFARDTYGQLVSAREMLHYGACLATPERLLVLYTGQQERRDANGARLQPLGGARFVHVFDWDGKLKAVLQLDARVEGIGAGPEGEMLGAGGPDGEVRIFTLPGGVLPGGWK